MKTLLGIFVFSLVGVRAGHSSVLVNGTAARVGKTTITIQDVYLYDSFRKFIEGAESFCGRTSDKELATVAQKMVLEEIVFLEMKSLRVIENAKQEAKQLLSEKKAASGRDKLWKECLQKYGKTEEFALLQLAKSLEVEEFLKKKADTLAPLITEEDIEKHHQQSPKYAGKTLETARAEIHMSLRNEKRQQGIAEWLRILREKYSVALFVGK